MKRCSVLSNKKPFTGDLNAPTVLDKNDPNYVDDEPAQSSAASSSPKPKPPKRHAKLAASEDDFIALDPQETYKKTCIDIINEYFQSEDVGEVAESLVEANHSVWKSVRRRSNRVSFLFSPAISRYVVTSL